MARWHGTALSSLPTRRRLLPLDLEDFTTSAIMLDMIVVGGKSWADDKCLAGLVRALRDILHPQAHLCSCGTNGKLTREKIKQIIGRGTGGG
jgi:hypothetical protein